MRVLLFFIIVLVVGAGYWFFSINGTLTTRALQKDLLKSRNVTLHGVRMVEKKFNKPSLEIVAAKSIVALDESKTDFERFTLVSYSQKAGAMILSAEHGTMINKTKNLSASGNVVARDRLDRALITQSLNWDNTKRVITTDDQVRVFGSKFVIKGRGMIAWPDDEIVEFLSDVHATFEPAEAR